MSSEIKTLNGYPLMDETARNQMMTAPKDIDVSPITGGHRITITFGNGSTKTIDVMDGANGDPGTPAPAALVGTTSDITPLQAVSAIAEGREVVISHTHELLGDLTFNGFAVAHTLSAIVSTSVILFGGETNLYQLAGWFSGKWECYITPMAQMKDVPNKDDLVQAVIDALPDVSGVKY